MTKVVIVGNANKDNVVMRLMRQLSDATGWKIRKAPDPTADINYFWLYLSYAQGLGKFPKLKGKTAAYFSHYDEDRPQKVAWWHEAAQAVDIRLVTAPQYIPMLERYGETHLVIPPVDPQFEASQWDKKIVGISGFTHPQGRKGEYLISKLKANYSNLFYIKASGKGWDADEIELRAWEDMPSFYQSLDVYLCTSSIEGVPLPPLEALACGVPIVVPRGVGLLDYLPDDHVYRYEKNNFEDMVSALKRALYPRNSVSKFSEWNWAESHKRAFGLSDKPPIVLNLPESAKKATFAPKRNTHYDVANSGAVVIAYGKPAKKCAETILLSWRKEMSDYPIALISDEPLGIETTFIYHEDSDIGARSIKTRLYDLVPKEWKNVLYLDADTEIVNDISILFKWLADGFEFLICTNPVYYKTLENGMRPDNVDETEHTIQTLGSGEIIQPNGGVYGYTRNRKTQKLFKCWNSEWERWGKRDQHALLRAMKQTPLRWLLLNNIWNTVTRYDDPPISESGGVLHHVMKARRWTGIIEGRLDSEIAWKAVEKWERENV